MQVNKFINDLIFYIIMNVRKMNENCIEKYSMGEVESLDDFILNSTNFYKKWLNENKDLCDEYLNSEDNEKYELIVLMKEPIVEILPIIECIYDEYNDVIEEMIKKFITSYSF